MYKKIRYPYIKSELTRATPFSVFSDDMIALPHRRELHCHDIVSILYIEKENVVIRTLEHTFKPKAGDFVFLLPGTAHALLADNPANYHTDIYVQENYFYQSIFPRLCDNPVFMNFFFNHMMPNEEQPHKRISTAGDPFFKEKIDAIHKEFLRNDNLSLSIMSSELVTLLAHLARIHHEETKPDRSRHAKADEIVGYISAHFLTVTLNELSYHFHYSPNYISQSLRSETGKSFTEWLHYFRTNHAISMLCNTDLPAVTIATACGFENPKYFYRVFKKLTGMTPSEYRENQNSNVDPEQ